MPGSGSRKAKQNKILSFLPVRQKLEHGAHCGTFRQLALPVPSFPKSLSQKFQSILTSHLFIPILNSFGLIHAHTAQISSGSQPMLSLTGSEKLLHLLLSCVSLEMTCPAVNNLFPRKSVLFSDCSRHQVARSGRRQVFGSNR